MSEPTKSLSALMDELSSALTDLSDKMGSLSHVLENNTLDPQKTEHAVLMQPNNVANKKINNQQT